MNVRAASFAAALAVTMGALVACRTDERPATIRDASTMPLADAQHDATLPREGAATDSARSDSLADAARDVSAQLDGARPEACPADASGSRALPCIVRIDGRAVDASGAPIAAGALVSACGPTQCSPARTLADGTFSVPVGFRLDPDVYALFLHVRPTRAGFYYALPKGASGPIVDLGALRVLDLPGDGPSLDVNRAGAPEQVVTSGDVTLDVPAGVYVRLDVESNLDGERGKQFRALTVPGQFIADYTDAALGVRALFALEPFESSFVHATGARAPASVRLSFANTAALAAGGAVDVLALGSYVYPEWVTPAAFERVAGAHVSADGSTIELDPGEGLPHLTWVAIRPV